MSLNHKKPDTLYHCLLGNNIRGSELEPSCLRNVNGKEAKYLFATPYITKSLAFAFSYAKDEVLINGSLGEAEQEFVVICDREKTLSKDRAFTVYEFDNIGFQQFANSRQWVSEQGVKFKDTNIKLSGNNVQDLMEAGLQILSTNKTADQLTEEGMLDKIQQKGEKALIDLIGSGELIWENKVQGIAISEELNVQKPGVESKFIKSSPLTDVNKINKMNIKV